MSLDVYRVLHLLGVLTLFSGLTALWGVYAGQSPELGQGSTSTGRWRRGLAVFHGLGLLIILVSGFGMLARLGQLGSLPAWAIGKLVIWFLLGGSVTLAKRKSDWGIPLLSLWVALGGIAAYLCIFKPG